MNKKSAFLLAFLITLLFAINFYFLSQVTHPVIKEKALLVRVIDGDTLEINGSRHVRLLNINSPEKNAPNHDLSITFLKTFENSVIDVEINEKDKYNRSLVRVYKGEYLNLKIVQLGLASKFLVTDSELKTFTKAEDNAIKNGVGIWIHSKYFGCFISKINQEKEEIELKNTCNPINTQNWFLKDESRKTYKFSNISLGKIKIHSFKGIDNATDLFIGSTTNIWNNDRDSLYLFDSNGNIVHYHSYGY